MDLCHQYKDKVTKYLDKLGPVDDHNALQGALEAVNKRFAAKLN